MFEKGLMSKILSPLNNFIEQDFLKLPMEICLENQ